MQNAHRILVVDDDKSIRQTLKAGLALHGFSVFETGDCEDAVTMIAMEPAAYKAVLMEMETEKGLHAAHAIRQIDSKLPIAFMTADDESVLRSTAKRFGSEIILKPFHSMSELTDAVKAIIGEK